ncbi:serine hydrolase domain-containing protein [Terriglobus aquaticus]|uniref:Serine hydrolase domain-containing protein n=1 Tax=Terriglobus aquaticus TaxID=940139 RepID=A0ABW9KMB8_9BACT|nr:serine hydrolase domain-containing protein [Terriglobus aquaticus]
MGQRPGQTQPAVQGAGESVTQRLAKDLTWTPEQRETRFAHMDQVFPTNPVHHGSTLALTQGAPLQVHLASGETVRELMQRDRFSGILVLQRGKIRFEEYGIGATAQTRWTSFSVSKSVTSTLVGYALRDKFIRSADDDVTKYIPELVGSSYDGVSVRQLAEMTSGVRWVEDYTAPDSDNVKLYESAAVPGRDQVVEYMRKLPPETAPGTKFVYKTGETDLLGVLVQRAVGSSLSAYLQRTLWREMRAESDAFWIADGGREFGGSGLSATLRDFGRFGEFVRTHRAAGGWLAAATRGEVDNGRYGLGWWTFPDGSFAALGIFGQSILVDPRRELVVVTLGAWPAASSAALVADRAALWEAVRRAVDEPPPGLNR